MQPNDAVAALARETRSSIELKLSAKGEYHWDTKVYYDDGDVDGAINQVAHIDAELRMRFTPERA